MSAYNNHRSPWRNSTAPDRRYRTQSTSCPPPPLAEPLTSSMHPHPAPTISPRLPSTIHSKNIFFTNTPAAIPPRPPPPTHSSSVPDMRIPNLPVVGRIQTSPYSPYSAHIPQPVHAPRLAPIFPPGPLPVQAEVTESAEDNEFQAALAMSQSESTHKTEFLQKMTSQEEEDLARALEESTRISSKRLSSFTSAVSPTIYSAEAGPSNWFSSPIIPQNSVTPSPLFPSPQDTSYFPYVSDRSLERPVASSSRKPSPEVDIGASPVVESYSRKFVLEQSLSPFTLEDDEALARRLFEEEKNATSSSSTQALTLSDDEAYARLLAAEEEKDAKVYKPENQAHSTRPPPPPKLALPTYADAVSPNSSFVSLPSSASHDLVNSPSRQSSIGNSSISDKSLVSSPLTKHPRLLPVDDYAVNPNYYVDRELLNGVSIGFHSPSITANLEPMPNVMPNIISMPYGKCPPLHIQAPTWRSLLKLMAWLSGTRLEPTVEALALMKDEPLRLRTVVQFIKPYPTSSEWRTVLWFTIDHAVPKNMPGSQKYTNRDVDVLPWTYTLSSIPQHLRDGSDTPMSKYYNIPSSESLPHPPLPITFPNLAAYLQAALADSRRYMNDSSSGIRKLAKMVDLCYPSTYVQEESSPLEGGRRMSGLMKKVWGRNRNQRKGRGNEDTYELVTPFVPDQWG